MIGGLLIAVTTASAASPDQPIRWETDTLDVTLAAPNDGMGLLSLRHGEQDAEFLKRPAQPSQALLWKVRLTDDISDESAFITVDNTAETESRRMERRDGELILRWQGVELPGTDDTVDVTVRGKLDEQTGFTAWRIAVRNPSKTHGIYRVVFPVVQLGRIGETAFDDYLICSPAEGRSVRNPIGLDAEPRKDVPQMHLTTDATPADYRAQLGANYGFGAARPHGLPYPTGRGQLQLSAYYQKRGHFYYPTPEKGPGLYLAPHDGNAHPKVFFYTPNADQGVLNFEVGNYPDNSAQPELDYHMPYPMIIGGFNGDWYDASRIYRKWALQQKWTRKGSLNERDDLPEWIKQMTLMFRADVKQGDNEIEQRRVVRATEKLTGPVGVQWYHWSAADKSELHAGGAGAFPPNAAAPSGFADVIETMQSSDAHVFPYLNTRLWNLEAEGYERIKPELARQANGEIYTSVWGERGASHVCVHSDWWADYLAGVSRQLVRDYGVHGLYLDQAGSAHFGGSYKRSGCYDPSHGHPLGVTRSLVEAEHERMSRILEAAHEVDPNVMLTGEGLAEPFIDVFANKLIHYEIWPGYVPLFSAVYHDYITFYGRTVTLKGRRDPEDPIPAMQIGWQLVLGNQLGRLWSSWMSDHRVENRDPIVRRHLAYLQNALKVRKQWSDFLMLGQMRRPPYILSDVPVVTTHEFRKDQTCSLPAVLAGTWQGPDGQAITVVTNISREPLKVRLAVNSSMANSGHVRQGHPTTAELALEPMGDDLVATKLTIEPLAIHVLEWEAE